MANISIAAALAASPPPGTASPRALELWTEFLAAREDYSDVVSHSSEGISFTRDLARAERRLLNFYEAYQLELLRDGAAAGTDPTLLQRGRGRTFDFSNLAFHEL